MIWHTVAELRTKGPEKRAAGESVNDKSEFSLVPALPKLSRFVCHLQHYLA
jgi:hypothetical protein